MQLGASLICEHEVWELCLFNPITMKWEPSQSPLAQLKLLDIVDEIGRAPEGYSGPIPTFETQSYVTRIRREVDESRDRRGYDPIEWVD